MTAQIIVQPGLSAEGQFPEAFISIPCLEKEQSALCQKRPRVRVRVRVGARVGARVRVRACACQIWRRTEPLFLSLSARAYQRTR